MTDQKTFHASDNTVISCKGADNRNWYAWNNLMPPKPDDFHVIGQVEVANYGIIGELVYRSPQGINASILLLNLVLIQRSGIWPPTNKWIDLRYDQIPSSVKYECVEIFCENDVIAKMDVEDIH